MIHFRFGRTLCLGAALLNLSPLLSGEVTSSLDIARQLNQAFIEVADKVSPAVVVLEITLKATRSPSLDEDNPWFEMIPRQFRPQRPPRAVSQGSGVVVREDGYIVTNSHVVEDADKIKVRLKDGKEYAAEIRGVDPQSDLAVVKIDARGLSTGKLGDSSKTRVGEFAIAIGAPFDLDYSVTFGHVSAKGRSHVIPSYAGGAAMDQDFIQTDASINPGNSGGPLVNINGEIIGINTIIRGLNTGIGFAVPANLVREVTEKLIAEGKYTRSWLGVSIVSLSDDRQFKDLAPGINEGVVVREIIPGGPAAKSELKPADIVTAVDGQPVATSSQLKSEIRNKPLGQPVTLDVIRDGKKLKIKLKPEPWPEEETQLAGGARPNREAKDENQSLGIRVQALTTTLAQKLGVEKVDGVLVTEVDEDSLGTKAGIKSGDVITEINRKPVGSPKAFREVMAKADAQKGILVLLVSEGTSRFVVLKEDGE